MLASFGKESGSLPSGLIQVCDEATVASDFPQIVSFTTVDLITSEITDLHSLAGEKGIVVPVCQSFTRTRPKPIDNRLHTSGQGHASLCRLNLRFEPWNQERGSRP